jgi:hypothetical protein
MTLEWIGDPNTHLIKIINKIYCHYNIFFHTKTFELLANDMTGLGNWCCENIHRPGIKSLWFPLQRSIVAAM